MSFVLSKCLYHVVLKHDDSLRRAKLAAPVLVFLVTLVIALFTLYKGGKGVGLHKTPPEVAISVSFAIALCAGMAAYPFVQWWSRKVAQLEEVEPKKASAEGAPVPPPTDGYQEFQSPQKEQSSDAEAHLESKAENEDQKVAVEEGKEVVKDGKDTAPAPHSPTERLFTGLVVVIAGFFSP